MAENINPSQLLKSVQQRRYLARDFSSLRANLIDHAKVFYPDKVKDLSEHGVMGLILDFAAIVGDNLSFYLDHQFSELDPELSIETSNIERHLHNAGVPILGASPATVYETIYVIVPAENSLVMESALPIVHAGTTFLSNAGIVFSLTEDIDFSERDENDDLKASVNIFSTTSEGAVRYFVLSRKGYCISGNTTTESVSIGSTFIPFRRIKLINSNVHEIVRVVDNYGNTYHEVSSLTDDVVFEKKENQASDEDEVKNTLHLKPAPYRFVVKTTLSDRSTTLIFGGGSADSLDDDVIPDPTEFALPIKHKSTFSRIALNPEKMLTTRTFGVATTNTTLQITYRYGGGLSHNAPTNTIQAVQTLNMSFPGNPVHAIAGRIRDTIEVNNLEDAQGGEPALTIDELKVLIPSYKNSQERIVSKSDLLARIYTIPTNYGKVFRAAVNDNPNNPNATELFVISRDINGKLRTCPDSLKKNIKTYLAPYRLISDAIDILDAEIINLRIKFAIIANPKLNKSVILKDAILVLEKYFNQKNFSIDQPINISDVRDIIWNVDGVRSIDNLMFESMSGTENNRSYNTSNFNVNTSTIKGFIFPSSGGIFEIKYPEIDIIGKVM